MAAGMDAAAGRMRPVAIRTLGCKVNTYESEQILERLVRTGRYCAAAGGEAELVIVNSCTVTREADRQTRQEIRRSVRDNPNALVVVTGCYAEMDAAACSQVDGVDLVVGNALKLRIPEILSRFEAGELPRIVTAHDAGDLLGLPDLLLSGFAERARAFVQIQQGCDQGCTFCIIHRARGASRSIAPEAIVRQVRRLAGSGFREFVLCGVDLGSWGRDLGAGNDFVTLLRSIIAVDDDFRIRLGSLDPVHIDPELVDLIAAEPRLCPHLHVSMQSGHTLILKRMKRRYDREALYRAVLGARDRIDDLVVGADVMAGFPTEDDEHFEATRRAIVELDVAFPHVFPYSPRPGTPAARIPRQVDAPTRQARAAALRETGREVLERTLHRFHGRHVDMLVEGTDGDGSLARGRLANYLPATAVMPGADDVRGQWCRISISGNDGASLHGESAQLTLK